LGKIANFVNRRIRGAAARGGAISDPRRNIIGTIVGEIELRLAIRYIHISGSI
jgi:hypothetical protein